MKSVYICLLICRPAANNRCYHRWETARLSFFIDQPTGEHAEFRLKELLRVQRWELVETLARGRITEDEAEAEGGAMLASYRAARSPRGFYMEIMPDHFGSGKDDLSPARPPRLDELFVDQVFEAAGGRRLTPAERNFEATRNADYLIDDYIFELKDIQEEGLEKPDRQAKIADLFRPYFPDAPEILVDPTVLSVTDRQQYIDIVTTPIRNIVRSAAHQVRLTKRHLGNPNLRGGLFVMNTGYYSLPPGVFFKAVARLAATETSQLSLVACVSTNLVSDGFNSDFNSRFYPPQSTHPVLEHLSAAYGAALGEHMTKWSRAGFQTPPNAYPLLQPIVFEDRGQTFRYFPPGLPPPWTPD